MLKKTFVLILVISLINVGCSSYRKVSLIDHYKIEESSELKVLLKSNEEKVLIGEIDISIAENDTLLNCINDSSSTSINFSEIQSIKINEVDVTKFIFASFWITLGVVIAFLIVYPVDFSQ